MLERPVGTVRLEDFHLLIREQLFVIVSLIGST